MRALVAVVFVVAAFPVSAQVAVDTSGLDATQKAAFDKILAEEVCPCDCPKSFGQCVQEGSQCKPALLLAEWTVKSLEEGIPAESVAEALAKEITTGFTAPPKKPVLEGYSGKGSNKPKVTIVEYADFECAHCRAASAVVEELVKKRSDVRVVYKHFPLSIHPMARLAAIAAEAAALQGKFWPMHDALFATQDLLSDELILGHAKALGLDVARFKKDIVDPAIIKKVDDSRAEGTAFGIAATPAFFIDGRPYFLHRSLDGFELRMKMDQARATSSCR